MRARKNRVQVRLSDDEYDYFWHNVNSTGLSAEAYLRSIIANRIPKTRELRELDKDILSQLYAIGNNLNQISRRAHSMQMINLDKFDNAVESFKDIMNRFMEQM